MENLNINDILHSYHDNDLQEIIAETPQNYFMQKDSVKQTIAVTPVPKVAAFVPQKSAIVAAKPVANHFIKPVFSTSDALSTLAKKGEDRSVTKSPQAFISLNDIIAKAKKLADESKTLDDLHAAIDSFDGCNLKKMATNTVFADGNPNAKVMVIGEAPGNHEDLQGIPFCGETGELLDGMFRAINMTREDFYISNVIFWRPPGNRRPTYEELAICRPFLERQIQLANPEIVVLVGATAMTALTGITEPISKVRGKLMDFEPTFLPRKIKTFAVFHPSYLMRQTSKKRLAWLDMINLEKFLKDL